MNRNNLPSIDYIRSVARIAVATAPVERRPSPLKGKPRAPQITPGEMHAMRRMKMAGMLNKEIEAATGRSQTAVALIVGDLTKAKRGEREKRADVIRTLRAKGATWKEIHKATGACRDAIRRALK